LLGGKRPGEFHRKNSGVVKALSGDRLIEHDDGNIMLRDDQGAVQIILNP
jgi:hypothetical protein